MSATIHSQSTVVTMLPETAGTDSPANAAMMPISRPATTVRAATRRGSPASGGWLLPAGRITRGSTTSAPSAAASASPTRTANVGSTRLCRANHEPAYPPAMTATLVRNATQVSCACQGPGVGKSRSQRTMPSPYPMPSWPAPASTPAPTVTPSVFAQVRSPMPVRTAMPASLRGGRAGRDPPSGQHCPVRSLRSSVQTTAAPLPLAPSQLPRSLASRRC